MADIIRATGKTASMPKESFPSVFDEDWNPAIAGRWLERAKAWSSPRQRAKRAIQRKVRQSHRLKPDQPAMAKPATSPWSIPNRTRRRLMRRIARHEAGHAVAFIIASREAWLVWPDRIRNVRAVVYHPDDWEGCVMWKRPIRLSKDLIHAMLVCILAGPAADMVLSGIPWSLSYRCLASDRRIAKEMHASLRHWDTSCGPMAEYAREAIALVKRERRAIEELAMELERRGFLTGGQVERIVVPFLTTER